MRARVRARSPFLSAGDLGPQEVLRASARHLRTRGVREGLQSSVSGRVTDAALMSRCRTCTLAPAALMSLIASCPPAGPTAPSISRSSSSSCGSPDSSSVKVTRDPAPPRPSRRERSRARCVAGLASACGLLYLSARLSYFRGYSRSPQQR